MRVLIVEDHLPLAENIGEYLTAHGMQVDYAYDGQMALHLADTTSFDAILLDVSLPKIEGLEVARRLREDLALGTPILMLTARDTLDDKLAGFAAGSDDYLTKPFELAELEARLLALCRRGRGHAHRLAWRDLTLDTRTKAVARAGERLRITPTGLRILELLMRRAPEVVSRDEIVRAIWGEHPPEGEAGLRVHIHSLRSALGDEGSRSLIETLPGVGYRLVERDEN